MNDFKIITNDGLSAIITSLKERRMCGDSISPDLPYFFYRIPLQQGQENVSVNVSFTDSLLSEDISIVSNPKPSIRNGISLKEGVNKNATRSVESPLHYSGIKYQNGKGYLLLKITPFLYNVETHRLNFVKNVHLSFSGIPIRQNVNPVSIHEALNNTNLTCDLSGVLNDRTDNDTIDYLIITNSTLASSFNQLAQWKRRKCLRTKIVTLDSIYAQYSQYNDNPSKIKAYILDYASPSRKKWVLLGGDDSVVPIKYCLYSFGYGQIPTDWYYACYDDHPNLNWDTNNDGIAGQKVDSLDYTPCVYLSRLPVRTVQQVSNYTEKLINYENGININNNMLLTGYSLGSFTFNGISDSQYFNQEIFDEFVNDYWNGDLKKFFDTGSSYPQLTMNGDNLKSVIDTCFNVIHEISHGLPTYWQVAPNLQTSQYYYCSHADSLINTPGSVIVTGACLTNAFDYEPCLSKSFIRNPIGGAVAYFGCSRVAYGGEELSGTANEYTPIAWVDQYNGHFLHYLYTGTPTDTSHSIAAIATDAKTTVYNEFSDNDDDDWYHYHLLAMNIMGDPEMPVWTDTVHSFTSGNGPAVGPYLMHSMIGGSLGVIAPVGGCTIAVLDEHGTRQKANNVSSATFSGLDGETYVAIMKDNYIPYLTTTTVSSGGLIGPIIIHATHNKGVLEIYLEETIEDCLRDEGTPSTNIGQNTWLLNVTDLVRGNKKISQSIVGNSCQVSTLGWLSGVYAIQVIKDGMNVSTKIVIN